MDESDLKALGFFSQPDKCSKCKKVLVKGQNWYLARRYKICKSCDTLKSSKWAKDNPEKAKQNYEKQSRTWNTRYNAGRKSAKIRGVIWSITKEQYKILISNFCHYCNHELPKAGAGLDQIIPSKGYTLDNVVPCCTQCNQAKNSYFTYEEMLLVGKIVKEIKDKRKLDNL